MRTLPRPRPRTRLADRGRLARLAMPLALSPLLLSLALVSSAFRGTAQAQAAVTLSGTCDKLIIGGLDASADCKGTLMNSAERGRTTFGFSARDGHSLSFSGTGAQQERTEDTDPLQPINLVTPETSSDKGVVRTPTVAVGACRFATPEPGKTAIACEATAPDGRIYAGTFTTQAKAAPGAPVQ